MFKNRIALTLSTIFISLAAATCSFAAVTGTVHAVAPKARTARIAAACPAVPQPQVMTNPAFYTYVNTYNSDCAAKTNWDRSFNDVTLSSTVDGINQLSVTSSTALGGAIASLKINNKEFIASGGHGSASQFLFHAWNTAASECYNPAQAGSQMDDRGQAPYHGPSTSALYTHNATSAKSLQTAARPAMYISLADPNTGFGGCRASTYQTNTSPYSYGLSPYWLQTSVSLGDQTGLSGLENIIKIKASLYSEDEYYPNFDGVLINYLQRDFTKVYGYNPDTKVLSSQVPASYTSVDPIIRCTVDENYCLGMYIKRSAAPNSYYYAATNGPTAYNGMSGEYTLQMTAPATGVGVGGTQNLTYEAYLAVGNRARVVSTLDELYSRLP